MIGNRVRVVMTDRPTTGTLHRLDAAGATIWRDDVMPELQSIVFIPAHRILEVVDLGRASS